MVATRARRRKLHTGMASGLKTLWTQASTNPRWMLMHSLSRFAVVRNAVRSLHRRPLLSQYNLAASRLPLVNTVEFLSALKRHGYRAGLKLPEDVLEKLQRFAASARCYGDADARFGFRYADKVVAQAQSKRVFSQATYLFLDEIQRVIEEVARDPLLAFMAASYLNSTPVITGTRLWWAFATPEEHDDVSSTANCFQYDEDDYAALRLLFYVTPVPDDLHGPHVVVRGSHQDKPLSQLFSSGEGGDRGIRECYGTDRIETIYGEAGDGFAEDPFCFHKTSRPHVGDRLMLEIKYATRNFNIVPPPDRAAARNIFVPWGKVLPARATNPANASMTVE